MQVQFEKMSTEELIKILEILEAKRKMIAMILSKRVHKK